MNRVSQFHAGTVRPWLSMGPDHEPTQTRPRLQLNLLVVGDCAGVRASAHGSFPGDPYPSRGPVDLLILMSLLPCLSLILFFVSLLC